MPHAFRSLISSRRLRAGITMLAASLVLGVATLAPVKPVSAQAVDSHAIINISTTSGPVPSKVKFTTTDFGFGTCSTGGGSTFEVNGGSQTCHAQQFGPLGLQLAEVPYGYTLNGFSGFGSVSGSYSCGGSSCSVNYTSGTATFTVSFSPIPGPSASQLSVSDRDSGSVKLAWTASSAPGGLQYYQILRGGQAIATTTGRTFTNSGLACNTAYNYSIRTVDNYGHVATSNTVSTGTTACPVAPAAPAAPKKNTSTDTTAVEGTSTVSTTGTSSATTDEPSPLLQEPDDASDEIPAEKKHRSAKLEILIALAAIGLTITIIRAALRRATKENDDYWTRPPQY